MNNLLRKLPAATALVTLGGLAVGLVGVLPASAEHTKAVASATRFQSVSTTSLTTSLPEVIGTRTATAALLIRTTSGTDYKVVATVPKGTRLSVTGVVRDGRAEVVYRGSVRWVTAKYLSTELTKPPLPAITGIRYATVALLIRSTNTDTFITIATVPKGTKLSITGVVVNGRAQIIYSSAVRWVTAKYLSTTAPTTTPPPAPIDAVEEGLSASGIALYRAARAEFPQITTYYGYRNDPTSDHSRGNGLDLMIPSYTTTAGRDFGYKVAAWAQANAATLKITYIIWDQRIWSVQRSSEGWRPMADRGGVSANHKDHVHISVY